MEVVVLVFVRVRKLFTRPGGNNREDWRCTGHAMAMKRTPWTVIALIQFCKQSEANMPCFLPKWWRLEANSTCGVQFKLFKEDLIFPTQKGRLDLMPLTDYIFNQTMDIIFGGNSDVSYVLGYRGWKCTVHKLRAAQAHNQLLSSSNAPI